MKKLWFLALGCSWTLMAFAQSDNDSDLQESYSHLSSLCNSSLSYSPALPLVEASQKYHEAQNKVIRGAVVLLDDFREKEYRQLLRDRLGQELSKTKQGEEEKKAIKDFQEIVLGQNRANPSSPYVSFCRGNDEVATEFSSCRVEELLQNEWCAYSMFLTIKNQEPKELNQTFRGKSELFSSAEATRQFIESERSRSKSTLILAMERYTNYWWNRSDVVYHSLQISFWEKIRRPWHAIRQVSQFLESKFTNATIQS